jgi:hypothetical protein
MKIKELLRGFFRILGKFILPASLNILCRTLRVVKENENQVLNLIEAKKNIVFAFWHGTMLYPWFYNRKQNHLGLISKSKDGDLLANVLKKWNYKVARGSSSKGGEIALGILVDYLKHEGSIAITPDGPRGPKHQMKAGAVVAAKKSKSPLVLVGVAYKDKFVLNNWDQFEIPKPFTKTRIVFSEAVYIDPDLSYEGTTKQIQECELKLNYLQNVANKF